MKNKKYIRCAICTAVSDKSLQLSADDPVCDRFYRDPNNKKDFICEICYTSIYDALNDFIED